MPSLILFLGEKICFTKSFPTINHNQVRQPLETKQQQIPFLLLLPTPPHILGIVRLLINAGILPDRPGEGGETGHGKCKGG